MREAPAGPPVPSVAAAVSNLGPPLLGPDRRTLSALHEMCFHTRLLDLFICINKGASERVHAKMRGNCGLEDVLNALHDEHILPEVFRSLCEYLTAAYLVSELDDELLTASKDVCNRLLSAWESMIKKFTATYNDSSQWTAAAIAHQQCIVGGILPCCAAYVRRL